MKPNITERQILGAKVRAAEEAWTLKHQKPCGGGFLVPLREERDRYLSRKFGMPPHRISYFLTWSRTCTHPWSEGACEDCPE